MNGINNKVNILAECQKEFIFNSKYEIGHLNDDEKLVYLSCAKTNKGVGAYLVLYGGQHFCCMPIKEFFEFRDLCSQETKEYLLDFLD